MRESETERKTDVTLQENSYFNVSQIWQQMTKGLGNVPNCDKTAITNGATDLIIILGKTYANMNTYCKEIIDDIYTKISLTYRVGFEGIPKAVEGPQPLSFIHSMVFNKNILSTTFNSPQTLVSNECFTTDIGWGCMIRTSQSLLANACQLLLLGRDYRYSSDLANAEHDAIIDMFKDSYKAPFSLHNFIKAASELPLQVKPGQWFGPNAASLSIKRLCHNTDLGQNLGRLEVVICENGDLYEECINEHFTSQSPKCSVLVLLPLRLGLSTINSYYHSSILQLIQVKCSVGIAGGKPSSSYYFVGYQGNTLLYLDPHNPQLTQADSAYQSYHTTSFQKLSIMDMDPSMLIGLLFSGLEDFNDFKDFCLNNDNKIIHFHKNGNSETKNTKSTRNSPGMAKSDYVEINRPEITDSYAIIDTPQNIGVDTNFDDFVVLDRDNRDDESLEGDVVVLNPLSANSDEAYQDTVSPN